MKWVDTDKKTRIFEEIMITFLFLQSTRVDWLVAETSRRQKDFVRTDYPAGDVDAYNVVCSWCAQVHVSIHSCDFTTVY